MKNGVIILSGGMDSVSLLYAYRNEISLALTFDYGSNHSRREIECAKYHCKELGIEHIVIPLDFIGKYFNSSLLQGADAIPEGNYDEENMKSTVVPFRNGIMLSIACGFAESKGLKKVFIANHAGDHAIYPDCRATFIEAMTGAMAYGTYEGVRICAPFTGLNKAQIAIIGQQNGVDFSKTYSCYKGGKKHCGKCGTCSERKEAFQLAGIEDPTKYEQ